MAKASRPSVGTTPTLIAQADAVNGACIVIRNPDGVVSVHLGGSDVTTNTGFTLGPGLTSPALTLAPRESLYGIVSVGTLTVHALTTGIEV